MALGPIRVQWHPEQPVDHPVDDVLVVLAANVLLTVDAAAPAELASAEYDLFFLARRPIEAHNASLTIWFPLPVPMTYGVNNAARRRQICAWQRPYLEQALAVCDPSDARSFGWDAAAMARLLPETGGKPGDDSAESAVRACLQQLQESSFAAHTHIHVEDDPQPLPTPANGAFQRYAVVINGPLQAGDMFHIHFRADHVPVGGIPGAPCSGTTALFHYEPHLEPIVFGTPSRGRAAPVVPCALLHVTLLFPARAEIAEPGLARAVWPDGAHVHDPFGRPFADGRWVIVCNAHAATVPERFRTMWHLPDCVDDRPDGRSGALPGYDAAYFLLATLSAEERHWLELMLARFDELSRREAEIAELVAASMTTQAMAASQHVTTKTIEKHVTQIYRKLGLDGLNETTVPLRKATLLVKAILIRNLMQIGGNSAESPAP